MRNGKIAQGLFRKSIGLNNGLFICATSLIMTGLEYPLSAQACHGGGAAGGAAPGGSSSLGTGAGINGYAAALTCGAIDDTSKFSSTVFGFISTSMSPDGHKGDPLGTGGKYPLSYDQWLSVETTPDLAVLQDRDLRVQYNDFGYLPLWRNNVVVGSVAYRFTNDLKAALSLSYGGETGAPGTGLNNGQIAINEATLSWMPRILKGFSLTGGNLVNVGGYCDIYNQAPLENFVFPGLSASYANKLGEANSYKLSLVGGSSFQNVTLINNLYSTDLNFNPGVTPPKASPNNYIASTRQRLYLYGKANMIMGGNLSLNLVAGYQHVPADSNLNFSAGVTTPNPKFPHENGWYAGASATYAGPKMQQTVAVTYGVGDVIMGWGSPDYVRYLINDSVPIGGGYNSLRTVTSFSKEGSSLLNGIYWGNFDISRVHVGFGAWISQHQPAENPRKEVNLNYQLFRYDSSAVAYFQSQGIPLPDSILLNTEPYTDLKFAISPSLHVFGPLYLGMRFDHIRYLNPDAHTNAQEALVDPALNRKNFADLPSPPDNPQKWNGFGPAPWEIEAVNANIFSPFIALEFPGIGGINVMYSQGNYAKPIRRQGTVSRKQENVTINAFVNYTFKKKTAPPASSLGMRVPEKLDFSERPNTAIKAAVDDSLKVNSLEVREGTDSVSPAHEGQHVSPDSLVVQ